SGDPRGVSYLELHLFPDNSGVNDDTIYDLIPVPAENEAIDVTIEVPDDVDANYCVTAFQVNGAGDHSAVSDPFACGSAYISYHEDGGGGGCSSATPMGGLVSVLGFVFAASRRRRGSAPA